MTLEFLVRLSMFESWTQWHWVAFAWGQVIIPYTIYNIYLYKRIKKLKAKMQEKY